MAQNIDLSATTLQQAKTALAFTDGYEKTAKATNPLVAQIALLQTNLSVYSELLQHLSVAYAALGALASYDASASFNTVASRLSSSVDAFSQSVGSTQPPLHTNLSTLVDAAGDAILSSYQAGRVRAASDALLVQLNRVIAILNSDDVRQKIVPSAALVAGDIDAAALILYGSGSLLLRTSGQSDRGAARADGDRVLRCDGCEKPEAWRCISECRACRDGNASRGDRLVLRCE